MSRVFLATSIEDGGSFAAKVYNKNVIMRQTLGLEEAPYVAVQREIGIMASLDHRYVLPIVEVIEDDRSNSLILLMPFADHGTLTTFLSENEVAEEVLSVCFLEIGEALRFIHSKNVVHRDIKPDNILVFSDTVFCLSDFSVSTQLESEDQTLVDTKGSPAFLSPEECGRDPFEPKPADVWAFGVTIFNSVFGTLPFNLDQGQGKTVANTVYAVSQLLEKEELVIPESASEDLAELLKSILQKDPKKRPTFDEILKSPWFDKAREVDETNVQSIETNLEEEEEEECNPDMFHAS